MQLEAEPGVLEQFLGLDRIYLHVPFAERERVKELGAKWDGQACSWFVTSEMEQSAFAEWRPIWPSEDDPIVKVLGMISTCWKCDSRTLAIVACQYEDQLVFANKGVLQVLASQMTADELAQVSAGPLRPRYSNMTKHSNWSNGCVECDALLGGLAMWRSFTAFLIQGQAELPAITFAQVPEDVLRGPRDLA